MTFKPGEQPFEKVDSSYRFSRMEESILALWEQGRVFERSLEKPAPRGSWVFYEGPPTANNMPHPGHVLTRIAKDCLPRYKTMQGHYVRRQAGWDTHGLPVELSVEAELAEKGELNGRGPAAILEYGMEKFNRRCFESVRRYEQEWVKLSSRVGYWLDYENAYFTFSNKYIESVWWLLKQIYDQGLMYKGYRIQWYSTLIGTGLSSHEVAQNYQTVKDPSATVRALVTPGQRIGAHTAEGSTYFLLWTTTPWTLLSNVALCVNPENEYVVVEFHNEQQQRDEYLVLAAGLLEKNGLDAEQVVARVKGSELAGLRYERLYDYPVPDIRQDGAETDGWRIVADSYVTLESGTGIVHLAPAFGEDDYRIGLREKLPVLNAIDAEGRALPVVELAAGKWFKEIDPEVLKDLKLRGLLFKSEKYEHNYPHCYRTDAPLISYPLESWFIKMSDPGVKAKLLAGNEKIYWQPGHIKHGRFGDWLGNVVDWSLSRDRFWGTPLPVWECEGCGHQECLGSYDELRLRCPERFEGVADVYDQSQFNPHRPYIDGYTYPCQECRGGTMKRVRFVIDCWFDAGSMPFSQLHYPFENKEMVDGSGDAQSPTSVGAELARPAEKVVPEAGRASPAPTGIVRQFPADFISEAIDQTRGWFYTLHAISTLIKGEPCYKSCLVLGHILDEKGVKMSKRLGNVVDPWKVVNEYGADAFRWYFYSGGSLSSGARFHEKGVLEGLQRFIIPLWNVYSFLSIYSNLDGFDPSGVLAGQALGWEELTELDKWILLKLNRLRATVADGLDRLVLSDSARAIESFVEELSNWYVRRSRRRFWQSERDNAKLAAYETLYKVLVELSKLLAPFIPFIAEELYQKLVVRFAESSRTGARPVRPGAGVAPAPTNESSVHLCSYPEYDPALSDDALETAMDQTLRAARLGHSARKESRLRVRQPLRKVVLVTREPDLRAAIESHREILLEELNVKDIEFAEDETQFVSCQYKPNFRLLGPRFGAQAKAAAAWISASSEEISRQLELHRDKPVSVIVENEDGEADLAETKWFNWVELDLGNGPEVIDERCFEVVLHAHEESIAERDGGLLLVLDTHIDEALKLEGLAREVVHRLQARRKELDLEYSQRIAISYRAEGELASAIEAQRAYICEETLADSLSLAPALPQNGHGGLILDAVEGEIDGQAFVFTLDPA